MNKALKTALKCTGKIANQHTVGYCCSVAMLVAATLDVWLKYQKCKELEEKKAKSQKIGF